MTAREALDALDAAANTTGKDHAQTEALERAITALLPYAPKNDLRVFWSIAGEPGGMHRSFRLRRLAEVIRGFMRHRVRPETDHPHSGAIDKP